MATAKIDEHSDDPHHPLAENRPGVYVQVVSPRRRKERREPLTGGSHPSSGTVEVVDSGPITVPGETVHVEEVRESGVKARPAEAEAPTRVELRTPKASDVPLAVRVDVLREPQQTPTASHRPRRPEPERTLSQRASENAQRQDLMAVHLPGPPRMPNISLSGSPLPFNAPPRQQGAASVLDAPRSIRPDSIPVKKGPSWLMLAGVAALSGIIAAAVVVAVRGGGPAVAPTTVAESPLPPPALPEPEPALLELEEKSVPAAAAPVVPAPQPAVNAAKPVEAAPAAAVKAPVARPAKPSVVPAVGAPAFGAPTSAALAEPTETKPAEPTPAAPESAPVSAPAARDEIPENPYAQ